MNFFERIFGKKEEMPEEKAEVLAFGLKDLDDLLDKKLEGEFKLIEEDVRKIYSDIKVSIDSLKSNLSSFEKSDFKGPLEPKVLSIVVGRKNSFINKMEQMAKEFERAIEFDYSSVLDFHNRCVFSLNFTNAKTGEDYRYLKEFFDKEVSQAIGDFKNLDRLLKEMGKLLKSKKENVDLALALKERNNSLKRKLESREKIRNELSRKDEMLNELVNKEKMLGDEVNQFSGSEEWTKLNERKKEKTEVEKEIGDRIIEVVQIVSLLDQVFRKFKKLVEDGVIDFQNRRFIELYINSPVDAFVQDGDLRAFYSILDEIKRAADENKIELKDKVLSTIYQMIESKELLKLKEDFVKLSNRKDEIQAEIFQSKIQEQKERVERDLASVRNSIAENKRENEIVNKKINEIEEEIEEDKLFIDEKLGNLMKQKVSISF